MRRRDFYWSLYHLNGKKQLDNLRTDQVEAVFAAIPEDILGQYFIWRDGLDSWKPFVEFPDLLIGLRSADVENHQSPEPPQKREPEAKKAAAAPVAAAPKKAAAPVEAAPEVDEEQYYEEPAFEETPSDYDFGAKTKELSLEKEGSSEDRASRRFEKRYDVRVIANGKAFPNATANISLKGMQLEGKLPAGLPKYFNVEIKTKERMIPVLCSEVSSRDSKVRVRIEVNNYASVLLDSLLKP